MISPSKILLLAMTYVLLPAVVSANVAQNAVGQEDRTIINAALIQNNLKDFVVYMVNAADCDHKNFGKVSVAYSNTPGVDYNMIFDYSADKITVSDLKQALDYAQKKLYPFMLVRDQEKINADEAVILEQFKYRQTAIATRMSVSHATVDLANLDKTYVKQITNKDMLKDFCDITDISFGRVAGSSYSFLSRMKNIFKDNFKIKLYLAYANVNGKLKPVATAMLYLPADKNLVAGHYGWSVMPEYRKQGIMSNLVKNMILVAKQQGYFGSVAQCYEASVGLAAALGFKKYGDLILYTNVIETKHTGSL